VAGLRIVQTPSGIAWTGAALTVALVPRWMPRAGALPRRPFVGAVCLYPIPLIAGVADALTPEVIAHEFAHVIWPKLGRPLRRSFPATLENLEREDPHLGPYLDACLVDYKDRRSPDETHVRLLEYYDYGRKPLPPVLRPFYEGWIELET